MRSIEGDERAGGGILFRQRLFVVEGRGDLLGELLAKWSGQGFLDFFLASSGGISLLVARRHISVLGMQPPPVVVELDVSEHLPPRLVPGFVSSVIYQLSLERLEERLGQRIAPRISRPWHRPGHPV